ncbi:hypothetical protein SAMN04489751_2378 [Brevibacterium sandarakinum]|uniref:DUF402 domain-containing protein n=1 Tax=Brevibacterium sandarakinum TaxID=629680 RepID=A0A1H1TID5_BRESA|nr:DUF402 domain-containing protein [Brevibacterium sandarakinum]SDS59962.1 hypothetical protein SAMN04489751_2378 [Brevibacterium sandarakinum]
MEFTDPYEIDVPPGTRHVGDGPFWATGETVTWSFRRFDFDRDHAEVRRPMRVIEDGSDGAVLWLAGGTETRDTRIVGWEESNPHEVPLTARFRPLAEAPRRINVPGSWHGLGVLKIVPPRVPFSVWVLLKPGAEGEGSAGSISTLWYVNLEATHRRTDDDLYTSDHILDITFPLEREPLHRSSGRGAGGDVLLNPNGAVFKDVDELAAAANYGAWPRAWSDIIRRNGSELLDHLGEFSWAFDPKWETKARELVAGATAGSAAAGSALAGATSAGSATSASKAELGGAETQDSESFRKQEHHRVRGGCYDKDRI